MEVSVCGTKALALCDKWAKPDIITAELAKKISVAPKIVNLTITVVTGVKYQVDSILRNAPIPFGGLLVYLDFNFVQGYPFDVLISDATMEALMATLDYETKSMTLTHGSKVAVLDWLPEFARLAAEGLLKERNGTDS